MKKIFTLIIAAALSATAFAQSNYQISAKSDAEAQQLISGEQFGAKSTAAEDNSRGTATCVDTNRWSWARSFNAGNPTFFTNQMINDTNGTISGWSVYFDVPAGESIDMTGFRMYGRSIRGDGGSVTLNCGVFNATADSLPDGTPVAATTISLDTTTSSSIAAFQNDVVFGSTATLNGAFVVVIELVTAGPGDSIEVLRGFTGSGLNDYPFAYKVPSISTTQWLSGSLFGGAFARIPHVYPFVSFDVTNGIDADTTSICEMNEVIDLGVDNPWYDNDYWFIEGFVGANESYWSVDGGSVAGPTTDTSMTFADPTTDYDVTVTDSLTTWFNGGCEVTETITLTGEAEYTNASVTGLAAGTSNTEACDNAPGTTTIYTITSGTTFYTDTLVTCTPSLVAAGFMSNGTTWWEFDASGVLVSSDDCPTNSVGGINTVSSKAFFTQGHFNVFVGDDLAGVNTVALFDVTGKNVKNVTLRGEVGSIQQFDASELPNGIYIVKAGEVSMKLVK